MHNVVIFRGFAGSVFSTGMDALGEKIKKQFPDSYVQVDGYQNWLKYKTTVQDTEHPVILIGHSFGGLAAYKLVSDLNTIHFPLVVTFDYSPYYSGVVGHAPDGLVPSNVKHALNFYQEIDPLVRGVHMSALDTKSTEVENILTRVSHVDIAKDKLLHDAVLKKMESICER
jgi:alpha-beta hydrolase superfamily lysophospholipase